MPKFYCDYCDTHLTHDSPSVRKTHCQGRKHKENVKIYYQKWMEDQAQNMIDATTAAFKAGKMTGTAGAAVKTGAAIPPPHMAAMGGPPGPRNPMGPAMAGPMGPTMNGPNMGGPNMGPMMGGPRGPMMGPGGPIMGPQGPGPMYGPGMAGAMGPGGPMGPPMGPMMVGPGAGMRPMMAGPPR